MTQNERILRHLRDNGSITPLDALSEYGIMRLASRISDLRSRAMIYRVKWCRGATGTARRQGMQGIRLQKGKE